jgi:hypothetical protein
MQKIRWFADFLVDLCFAMDCKLVLFCSVFIVMGTSVTRASDGEIFMFHYLGTSLGIF